MSKAICHYCKYPDIMILTTYTLYGGLLSVSWYQYLSKMRL